MRYRASVAAALFGWGLLTLAGCGGGSTTSIGGVGGATTPTVTVSPSSLSITTAQSLTVTVTVSGTSGTPSGSVMLTSGSYNSGALALTNGRTQITIPAGKLATGSDTLTAAYTSTSSSYNNASGSGSVTVTSGSSLITPAVTVLPFPLSIVTTESTMVTVMVNGGNGNPGPTGSVTLTSGSYNSGAVSLNAAEGQITIPAGSLATGVDTLTATYTPDNNSSSTYNGASGTGEVNVAPSSGSITPLVTISPNPSNITSAESTTITITVSGGTGNPTPTGSVILTAAGYNSGFLALNNGSAQITVHGSALGSGTVPLTVNYGPDANGSSTYTSATANGSVIVSLGSLLTPTVTVTPNPSSISTTQSTTVTVTVNGGTSNPTTTGSVALTCIQFNSGAVTLSKGSAQIAIPAGSIPAGNDTMTAVYTPDANSSSTYTNALGTNTVTVTAPVLITPTVTVSANPTSVGTTGSSTVTATVSGGSGNPTPTGSITLTGGTYNSGPVTLASGSAQITVQGSSLAGGSNILTANYAPDANSSSTYTTATGSATLNVVAIVSFTANPNPIPYGSTSAQLAAVFSGGTGMVTPGNLSVTSGTPVTVSPTANTTYTLTVTPSSGTAITQTVTVNLASGVTINPANPGIAVTDQILGMNMAVWYDFTNNGAYTANNSPIANAFKDAGIVALRWPGGSFSDDYHWNSGAVTNPTVGTAPTASSCNGAYIAPHTDYLSFINNLENAIPGGFDIALTANYGTNATCNGGGDPNEAANWVKYAYANGGTVSHVTIGNEDFGHWETDMHAVQWDPTTYANAVAGTSGYYDLIKAADPSTLVGIVVDANCTMANDCTDGWDSTVLSNAVGCNGSGTPCYDFVEYHYYAQHPGHETDTYLVQQAAQAFTANINTIKQELNTAGAPNTPIYVGEIGSATNVGKQSWSITQGLYAGQVLGEMMDDGVTRNTWFMGFEDCYGNQGNLGSSLYGWQDFGAFNIFSDGSGDIGYPNMSPCDYGGNGNTAGTMSPTAVAFDLFSNVAVNGEHVLAPSVTGDATDVVVYAATHSGGAAIVVFNRNETTSEPVTITVTGKSNSSDVTWYSYDKKMYDYTDTNCPTDPTCTVDPNHDYSTVDWVGPATNRMGQQLLPLTVTLQPWSMNVFIIQ